MDENQLNTTTNSGTQATTQNPQAVSGIASRGTQSSSLQPGTASSLLSSGQGVTLNNSMLTTVELGTAVERQVTPAPAQTVKPPINPIFIGLIVILCLAAIVAFWITNRSSKNTTNYS